MSDVYKPQEWWEKLSNEIGLVLDAYGVGYANITFSNDYVDWKDARDKDGNSLYA